MLFEIDFLLQEAFRIVLNIEESIVSIDSAGFLGIFHVVKKLER